MQLFKRFFGRGRPAAVWEPSDRSGDETTRSLTPEKVDSIMRAANAGDTADQCRLAQEILEKNHDIMQALQTRVNAVLGCDWSVEPGDGSTRAAEAARALETQLRAAAMTDDDADTFDDLLQDLLGALLPGFAVSEILWRNGGEIAGFHHIPQSAFTFRDGLTPRLVTRDAPLGVELPRERIVYHRMRLHGADPARGGLIRPLAWLHCFGNLHFKDLLGFIERYGMPFVFMRVDAGSFERERNTIKRLIRNFGSGGGGLFTKNVEAQLLQSSGNTGDVYFKLLEYCEAAACKVLLGQTASSGDSAGLSKGDAQSKVRQDILEADCRWLERTVDAQIFTRWSRYNFGAAVAPPRLAINCAEPEDSAALGALVQALAAAGIEADVTELSERTGLKLTRPAQPSATPSEPGVNPAESQRTLDLKEKYEAQGIAIRAGTLTATKDIEAQTRRELGLPEMTPEVVKAWDATGGIRQPITLKTAESAAVSDALNVDDDAPPAPDDPTALADAPSPPRGALERWLGPVADEIEALATGKAAPGDFGDRLKRLSSGEVLGDSTPFDSAIGELYLEAYDGESDT